MKMEQILQLNVLTDIRGQPIEPDGLIGMYHIRFNKSKWHARTQMDSFIMIEPYELVIRRKGHAIGIFRRKTSFD